MLRILAMGSPTGLGGGVSGWNYWPLLGFFGSLLLLRYVVDVRIRVPVVLACIVIGTLFAAAVDAWGIATGLAAAVAIALLARLLRLTPHAR
jgi:hypothetical protein